MDIYQLQHSRRTIRKFQDKAIDYKILEKFVDYSRLSSSAMNLQPIRYYIAHEGKIAEQIFKHTRWAGFLKGSHSPSFDERPRAYILFLYDSEISKSPRGDIGAASHAIQLMALNEGIGSCWMGAIDRDEILKICNIDKRFSLDSLLSLGYPAENPVAEVVADGNTKYYLDENNILHVPKLSLQDVLIK